MNPSEVAEVESRVRAEIEGQVIVRLSEVELLFIIVSVVLASMVAGAVLHSIGVLVRTLAIIALVVVLGLALAVVFEREDKIRL